MADRGDYKGIMLDTAERSYSEKRLKQSRLVYRLLGSIGKPKSFDRFRIQAASCLTHDTYELLDHITCPTLVIGGKEDKIVTGQASVEIAGRIADCKLILYDGLGHGLYEEAPCDLGTVLLFLSPCFMKQGDRNKRTVPALHGKDSLFGKYLMTCLKG